MDDLRRFMGRAVAVERLSDRETRNGLGVRDRWVPETIEAFDEIEFALPLTAERDAVLTLAVEDGNVARIMLGWAPAGDEDADARGFTEEELGSALERHRESLVRLLSHLTGS